MRAGVAVNFEGQLDGILSGNSAAQRMSALPVGIWPASTSDVMHWEGLCVAIIDTKTTGKTLWRLFYLRSVCSHH